MTIGILNYGMGNIGSISNMLKKINVPSILVNDPSQIDLADKLILPGVGSFDAGMERLKALGFSVAIKNKASLGMPILGICLGMQLLATKSEEGTFKGLNLIPGNIRKFKVTSHRPVPHMGWNSVQIKNHGLFNELDENKYYFVHSYYFHPKDKSHIHGETFYGINFASVVASGNTFGVQFHPEKSHKYGMRLLKNFSSM
jgi:imidazole glycerol-phosphate synthase subunit HisH